MKTKTRFHKITAWLLTLAILMTFIPSFTLTASADETAVYIPMMLKTVDTEGAIIDGASEEGVLSTILGDVPLGNTSASFFNLPVGSYTVSFTGDSVSIPTGYLTPADFTLTVTDSDDDSNGEVSVIGSHVSVAAEVINEETVYVITVTLTADTSWEGEDSGSTDSAPTTYTVTVNNSIENGTVIADVSEAKEGDTVTLTVTPAENYDIDMVTYNDGTSDVEITATEGVYSFTMPASNVTVTAVFKESVTYVASVTTAGEGGATEKYSSITDAITAAKENEGSTLTLLSDITTTATSRIDSGSFTIDLNGKTWESSERVLLIEGSADIKITDTTAEGTGKLLGTGTGRSTIMLINNARLDIQNGTVENTADANAINTNNFNSTTNARLTVTGGKVLSRGVTVIHAYGASVTVTGGTIESLSAYSLSRDIYYANGTIDLSNHVDPTGITIFYDSRVEPFDVRLPEGYVLLDGSGSAVTTPEADMRHTVGKTAYDVTVSDAITNGTVTADKTEATVGDTVTLTVTPNSGYEIDTVMYNGTAITANNGVYAFTMPASNVTVSATFKEVFTVTLSIGTAYTNTITDFYRGDNGTMFCTFTFPGGVPAGRMHLYVNGELKNASFNVTASSSTTLKKTRSTGTNLVNGENVVKFEFVPTGSTESYFTNEITVTVYKIDATRVAKHLSGDVDTTVDYDGTVKTVAVTSLYDSSNTLYLTPDQYTITYWQGEQQVAEPTNSGVYDVKITVPENDYYEQITNHKLCTLTINAPKTYTVTFVDGDGKTIGDPQIVEHGKAATAPADPTREGYTFDGWDQAFDNVTSDLTVQAQYSVNQYSIIYMVDDTEYAKFTRNYGENVFAVISNPTKTGYTFSGWSQSMPTTMPAHDVIITGSFTVNQYTITSDTDGGSDVAPIMQDYGSMITAPADPTKTGYTFVGWDKEIPAYMPAKNMTVKALWTINQYTVTFDTDGGTAIDPITQNYNSSVTAPAAPTKTGYTFAGWDKEIPATMPAENVTVKAMWAEKATVSITETAQTFIYDGDAKAFAISGTALTGFTVEYYVEDVWTKDAPTDAGEYDVRITRNEDDTYKAFNKILDDTLVIEKANAVITVNTTPIEKTYGETLILPTATTNFGTVSVDKTVEEMLNAGEYTVTYTVAGNDNYNGDTKQVSVKINPKKIDKPVGDNTSFVYDGSEQTYNVAASDYYTVTDNKMTNAGSQTVTVALKDKVNYTWTDDTTADVTFTFTIAQKDITGATVGNFAELKYTGVAQTPSATVTIDGLTVTGTWSDVTNAYDKTIFTANGNFTGTIANKETGMAKAVPTYTEPTVKIGLVYNGSAQELLTPGTADGGTMKYYIGGTQATAEVPTRTSAGEYTVNCIIAGDENHNNIVVGEYTATIAKKTLDSAIALTAPVKNTAPQTEIIGTGYTAAVAWSPEVTDKFAYNTEYTATITITPDENHTVTGIAANGYTVEGAKTVTNDENANVITVTYEKTGSRPSGGSSSNTTTTTTKNEDGSTTKTTTNKATGTTTEVTTNTDGSTTTVETKKDGTVTTTEKDKDGNTTTTALKPDGTSITTEKSKDGSEKVTEEKADGTTVTTEKDTDGTKTVTTENADGSTTTEEVRKDGTEVKTETATDGETTAEVVAKGETEVVIPVPDAEEVYEVVVNDEKGNETVITDFEVVDGGVAVTVDGNASVSLSKGSKKEFVDVHPVDHWSEESVDYVYIRGLMKGTSENHFSPDATLTRAMLVTILYRLEGEPAVWGGLPFEDVEEGSYYEFAVAWAKANGIVNGTSATTFEPNVSITREQIVAIMHRYADFKGHDVQAGENTNILSYDDVHHVSEYAIGAMQYAVGSGLIKGKTESTLNPLDNATRAEASAILERFIKAN